MYCGPNSIWISPDRRSRISYDAGAGTVTLYVDDVAVLSGHGTTGLATALALAVTGDQTFTGAVGASGGIAQATAPHGFHNWQPAVATSGTDVFGVDGTQHLASLFIPVNKTLTGVGFLVGSVGGTDKAYAVLYDADGAVLANSALTAGGATVGTAAEIQTLAFTATYAAKGPRLHYVGISINGGTAKLRTVPAHCQAGLFGGSVTQAHGTVAAVVEPVTFTADKAPVCFVY